MKKFKGMKNIDKIKEEAIKNSWEVDFTEFEKGSDWFWIRDTEERMLQICVNCWGNFFVYSPESEDSIASERSQEFDNEDWYNEILELLYEPQIV